jgi:hypothetical protein
MNSHLNYILAQQRIADLQRAAEHARLAAYAGTRRRGSRASNPIVRGLPMPTAHPSPEAWPDAQRAAREMLPAVGPDHTLTREGKQVQMCAQVTVPGGHGSVPVDSGTGPNMTDAAIGGHRCQRARRSHAQRPASNDLQQDTATQCPELPVAQASSDAAVHQISKSMSGNESEEIGHETQTC